ncbi:hypothetical protein H6F67_14800 [Microcoleus sp. FACHB-1515]|uniref:hypothetical protein n=1 Tax=Cyanophyceae TaxID=3028117 RepID=UPI001681E2B0|nr:hypothetical protein [Microcoleus sp. FACHB-1515]MBD2091121.1 hypothetical protein [Microcoleus sp. FACHB-1515]
MARPINRQCLECACLVIEQAKQRPCWTDERQRCHKRRSHYLKRGDRNVVRRVGYRARQLSPQVEPVTLALPPTASVILVIYSEQPDRFRSGETPVHAIGAELWIGSELQEQMVPELCYGKRGNEVALLPPLILKAFSDRFASSHNHGKPFTRFATKVHRHICDCPIVNPFQLTLASHAIQS